MESCDYMHFKLGNLALKYGLQQSYGMFHTYTYTHTYTYIYMYIELDNV